MNCERELNKINTDQKNMVVIFQPPFGGRKLYFVLIIVLRSCPPSPIKMNSHQTQLDVAYVKQVLKVKAENNGFQLNYTFMYLNTNYRTTLTALFEFSTKNICGF